MTSRKLTLRREQLAELSTGELRSVAGASGECIVITGDLCPTFGCTGYYPTIFDPCDLD